MEAADPTGVNRRLDYAPRRTAPWQALRCRVEMSWAVRRARARGRARRSRHALQPSDEPFSRRLDGMVVDGHERGRVRQLTGDGERIAERRARRDRPDSHGAGPRERGGREDVAARTE